MELLVRPVPFEDESLESYLLRLADENGFESYRILSTLVYEWLMQQDYRSAGAFPLELSLVNVHHAKISSGLRVRAIHLFQQLSDSEELPLLKLALMHSSTTFGNRLVSVFRDGVDIPRRFIRKEGIPICPECLRESPYIRQHWHFVPYTACHLHGHKLVINCPECGELLDYQKTERIIYCECGFELSYADCYEAKETSLELSQLIVGTTVRCCSPLAKTDNLSIRFGALLWFQIFIGGDVDADVLDDGVAFFKTWPEGLINELERRRQQADLRLVAGYNHTYFRELFGNILIDARQLPMRDIGRNFILREIVNYLTELVHTHPLSKQANIGDVLMSLLEISAVLSCNVEAAYRLNQEGYLPLAIRLKTNTKLQPHTPAFRLRDVIELRLARMQSLNDSGYRYLPAW